MNRTEDFREIAHFNAFKEALDVYAGTMQRSDISARARAKRLVIDLYLGKPNSSAAEPVAAVAAGDVRLGLPNSIQAFSERMAQWTGPEVCMPDRDQDEWRQAIDEVRAEIDHLWDSVDAYMSHTAHTERNTRRTVLMRTSKIARMMLAIADLCGWSEAEAFRARLAELPAPAVPSQQDSEEEAECLAALVDNPLVRATWDRREFGGGVRIILHAVAQFKKRHRSDLYHDMAWFPTARDALLAVALATAAKAGGV